MSASATTHEPVGGGSVAADTGSPAVAPDPGPTPRRIRALLSLMFFLEYAATGAFMPTLPLYLKDLGWSAVATGMAFSFFGLASLLSPSIVGQFSDRRFRAEHLLLGCQLLAGGALWVAAGTTAFMPLALLLFLHALAYVPTIASANVIAFRHLRRREREFGGVRIFGTLGWMAGGWAIGLWLSHPGWLPGAVAATLPDMLRLGALFSFALAVTCLFLPATHPERGDGARRVALWAALGQLRDPGLLVVMLVSFAISLAPPFVYPAGARFLESLGVSPAQVAPLMSLGQVSELLVCLLLGRLFTRFTFRSLFLMGLASSAIRFLIWSIGAPWELVLASLPLHGVSHGLVFLLGQIYVDQRSPRDIRASAQALHLAATGGIGGLAGNMLAGWLCDNLHTGVGTAAPSVNYAAVFAFPALLSVACFCTFAWLFRESSRRSET